MSFVKRVGANTTRIRVAQHRWSTAPPASLTTIDTACFGESEVNTTTLYAPLSIVIGLSSRVILLPINVQGLALDTSLLHCTNTRLEGVCAQTSTGVKRKVTGGYHYSTLHHVECL